MTEYQLLLLRFLRMTQDMPHLNHKGTEPTATIQNLTWIGNRSILGPVIDHQKREALREFYRLDL